MIIETISNPAHEAKIKFENLEPGTVFEFDPEVGFRKTGPCALKLWENDYVLLTYSDGAVCFEIGDGSMVRNRKITKVWGKLVGLKVQL